MDSSLLCAHFEDPGIWNICLVWDNHWYLSKLIDKVQRFVDERLAQKRESLIIHVGDCVPDKNSRNDFEKFLPAAIRRIIRVNLGNHDGWMNPRDPLSLWDFWISDNQQIITIRWAKTPDKFKSSRHANYPEELGGEEFHEIRESVASLPMAPRIIVTHDAPSSIVHRILGAEFEPSRTNEELEKIMQVVSKLSPNPHGTCWVYGHHHIDRMDKIDDITCLWLGKLNQNWIHEYRWGAVVL